ncbi:hypothetical protein QR685DRAFT_95697 [Neurospora intermedia]|uniref:Uncharacterized protein n=1 Tax=Neurospora intermedia TaxID=5142 RepID=A0ABR3D2S2_NEUIN
MPYRDDGYGTLLVRPEERLFLLDEQLSVQLTLVQCVSGPFNQAQQQIRQKLAEVSPGHDHH